MRLRIKISASKHQFWGTIDPRNDLTHERSFNITLDQRIHGFRSTAAGKQFESSDDRIVTDPSVQSVSRHTKEMSLNTFYSLWHIASTCY